VGAGEGDGRRAHLKFVHTADTHLGFEYTRTAQGDPKGRVNRAEAVFRNFLEVIRHAVEIQADLFIHSGDLFNKAYISRETLDRLTLPFAELKKEGIRVLLVPGNPERSPPRQNRDSIHSSGFLLRWKA
jgi:DNA repair exonuclease SbcCD nuclease subunit